MFVENRPSGNMKEVSNYKNDDVKKKLTDFTLVPILAFTSQKALQYERSGRQRGHMTQPPTHLIMSHFGHIYGFFQNEIQSKFFNV